jgi:hypothetical protein
MSMASAPDGELNLAALRPKSHLKLRLMFDGGWKWLTLIGVIFALVGIGTIFVAKYFIALEKRYEREGKTAMGTVTKKDTYTTTSSHGTGRRRRTTRTTHYRVYYEFTDAEAHKHSGKDNLSYSRWRELEAGSSIEIQYLPSDPAKNRPLAARHGKTIWFVVLFPVVFGGAGLVMLLIVGRRAAKHGRLLANGTLTRGVVEEKAERHDITINNRHPFSITYTFALSDGEVHTGKDLVTDLRFAAKLAQGEAVGVIYSPASPDECTLFREKWMKHFQASG